MVAKAWASARDQVLRDPAVINLNTGSCGRLPRPVFDRVTALRTRLAAGPMDFLSRQLPSLLWTARERLAEYVGTRPHRLAFTTNVTGAVNLVASSVRLARGAEILLTDQEYAPMRWCWERAARRQGAVVRTFRLPAQPTDPEEVVEAAAAAMGPRTRLFFFSHVVSATGLVMPTARLCEEAHRRGILTVVDGAQAPGFTGLDLDNLPCDYYAGSGHKWLLAPTGVGFLHFGDDQADVLQPAQVSWGYHGPDGHAPDERTEFGSTPRLRNLECEGTRDLCPWLAVPDAIDFQAGFGHERVRARARELAAFTRERLSGRHGLEPVTPEHPELSGAMTAFALPPGTGPGLSRELWRRFRIEVPVTGPPERPLLRVSTHFHNTETEVERLAEALKELSR
ncbi:aminotransferase class V-fold PLP-dependent enzyme [Amycolatopsis sp. YIM 10]|uniref:aminotransferase class V-fold PLP-dependent enzyme n=1 Tax=Amycolatopsis sp. YIM 10 TaxID=2653857 RepID=UPI0012906934|nr:aminotransferase class V-fold PLP-dependent enzyme [Amycolatopsis sp. YIM 10]QFU92991.1 Isopenicillin N epimerase [Amycolatopsis sp. YIM 10]